MQEVDLWLVFVVGAIVALPLAVIELFDSSLLSDLFSKLRFGGKKERDSDDPRP